MPETPDSQNSSDDFKDQVIVRHPDGKSEKFTAPDDTAARLRIGRELDNDIVLSDPRASRHHAELRRGADGEALEIKDLNSANGVLLGTTRIKADTWEKIEAGQIVQFGETRLYWEKAVSSQSTIAMTPAQRQRVAERTAVSPAPAATAAAADQPKEVKSPYLSWAVGGAAAILLLLIIGVGAFFFFRNDEGTPPQGAPVAESTDEATSETEANPAERGEDTDLAQQTPGSAPTETPTPTGPQIPIPVVDIVSSEVRPIMLGALPSTDQALFLVKVRVQNVGNAPFLISTGDFSLRTLSGQIFAEAGGTTSEGGLRRLGVVDRFDNLRLSPGGNVAESLLFQLLPEQYDLELVFESPDANPVVLGLGRVDAGTELALALGTPVAEETPTAIADAATPTPTPEPTPTPTRPAAVPAPRVVPRSALVGTIAYPVH